MAAWYLQSCPRLRVRLLLWHAAARELRFRDLQEAMRVELVLGVDVDDGVDFCDRARSRLEARLCTTGSVSGALLL